MAAIEVRLQTARLRGRRAELNLTQEALAELSGINQSTISQLERGMQSPSIQSLVGLSRILGVSIDWLLGMESERGESGSGALTQEELELVQIMRLVREEKRQVFLTIVRAVLRMQS